MGDHFTIQTKLAKDRVTDLRQIKTDLVNYNEELENVAKNLGRLEGYGHLIGAINLASDKLEQEYKTLNTMANVLDSSIKEYEQAEGTILGEKITVKQLADMAPMPKPKIVLDEEALYDIWTQLGEYEGFWWHDEDRIAKLTSLLIVEAEANGGINLLDLASKAGAGDAAAYHKLMVIQTIANVLRSGCYDEQTFNGLETNLTLLGK